MKRRCVLVGVSAALVLVLGAGAGALLLRRHPEQPDSVDRVPWRHLLTFDVTDISREHKGDVGNRTIVIARYARPVGWEVGVYAYPVTEESDNLLYDDPNDHGAQPWQSFAWSKQKRLYPDTRIIEYGSPPRKLKLVLKDCRTARRDDFIVFTAGQIEVYHHP